MGGLGVWVPRVWELWVVWGYVLSVSLGFWVNAKPEALNPKP